MSNKVTQELLEKVRNATEEDLRDMDVPWPETPEQLIQYVEALAHRSHDYGTCVYAMSMSAVAAFNYICNVQGTTGFQASCADLDILRRTRGMSGPFSIRDYNNMLYPQYADKFAKTIGKGVWEWLQKEAAKHLNDGESAHIAVRDHWQDIVDGNVPFGMTVAGE